MATSGKSPCLPVPPKSPVTELGASGGGRVAGSGWWSGWAWWQQLLATDAVFPWCR